MALSKNILWTIGGPESPIGTVAARTHVLPVRDVPSLTQKAARLTDPAIVGARMDIAEYLAKLDLSGGLPLSPRMCPGYGKLLKSALGVESTPAQLGAVIRLRYVGAGASCKIIADASNDTLEAYDGDLGAEIPDTGFGTGGVIDLTSGSFNTVAEIVAAIDGYADYECELVTGDGAVDSADIVQVTTQAKGRWAYLFFTSTSTGAYLRTFTADLTDTEHPAYTVEAEGYIDTGLVYNGLVVDALKHSASLGAFLTADMDMLGFEEAAGQAASGLSVDDLEDAEPLLFWKGSTEFGGKDFAYISTLNFTLNNSHNKESYGQGSAGRTYQQKSTLVVTGDMQLKLDADTYAHRASIFTSDITSASFMFKGKEIDEDVFELLIVEFPFIGVTSPFDFPVRAGAFDAKINWKAFNPKGTKYDVPVKFHFISADSGAF